MLDVKQSSLFITVDEKGTLTWFGHEDLGKWFVETHGLDYKKMAKKCARE